MSDLISRQAAIEVIDAVFPVDAMKSEYAQGVACGAALAKTYVKQLPSAQPERKKGKWTEKHHAYSDEESVIEEWQSCRCSECGRYDTRPYMYYFSEPNYCSYCGADMRGEEHETD